MKVRYVLFALLAAFAIVAVGGGSLYLRAARDSTVGLPSDLPTDLTWQELADRPIFKDLEQRQASLFREWRRDKLLGTFDGTSKSDAINWAPDIYAAIERATAEDKPILLMTHVPENGDPTRDV